MAVAVGDSTGTVAPSVRDRIQIFFFQCQGWRSLFFLYRHRGCAPGVTEGTGIPIGETSNGTGTVGRNMDVILIVGIDIHILWFLIAVAATVTAVVAIVAIIVLIVIIVTTITTAIMIRTMHVSDINRSSNGSGSGSRSTTTTTTNSAIHSYGGTATFTTTATTGLELSSRRLHISWLLVSFATTATPTTTGTL